MRCFNLLALAYRPLDSVISTYMACTCIYMHLRSCRLTCTTMQCLWRSYRIYGNSARCWDSLIVANHCCCKQVDLQPTRLRVPSQYIMSVHSQMDIIIRLLLYTTPLSLGRMCIWCSSHIFTYNSYVNKAYNYGPSLAIGPHVMRCMSLVKLSLNAPFTVHASRGAGEDRIKCIYRRSCVDME